MSEGDKVRSGDLLAEIETDKATMEFEAVDEGIIGKILISEGSENVKVNSTIAILLEDDEKLEQIVVNFISTEIEWIPLNILEDLQQIFLTLVVLQHKKEFRRLLN